MSKKKPRRWVWVVYDRRGRLLNVYYTLTLAIMLAQPGQTVVRYLRDDTRNVEVRGETY